MDVAHRGKDEVFALSVRPDAKVEVHVADVRPAQRHLLLMVREQLDDGTTRTNRFLCGHDERNWFVAASPGGANVKQAMEALKPQAVLAAQADHGVRAWRRNRRRNDAFVRQGEWFFLPTPNLSVAPSGVRRNEPLQRTGGKPHVAEFACRFGGRQVFICQQYPQGLTDQEYRQLVLHNPQAKTWRWWQMVRDPMVFVRGRIRHSDHRTISLPCWHQVFANTESQTAARANLAFLD
jgi:hypothetical protein